MSISEKRSRQLRLEKLERSRQRRLAMCWLSLGVGLGSIVSAWATGASPNKLFVIIMSVLAAGFLGLAQVQWSRLQQALSGDQSRARLRSRLGAPATFRQGRPSRQ